ncbi:uncharacterized protein LOC143233794 [Tachypleus tridentatus]|uniref:uncharacterized protein LOC143233794 n=1 Tax=Tachypleus tridentatus TaxID=6853 RepID=UPI003FD3E509
MKVWNTFFIFLIALVLPVKIGSNAQYHYFESTKKDKEVTCCMLGQLAGDKGFHCFVNFYIGRLWRRNYNRAHNRKMAFHGSGRIPNYGQKTMRTFGQCVAGFGVIFHKCCHLATIEKRIVRYNSNHYRRNVHQ